MNLELPKIYPITDARLSGFSHAEQVTQLIGGGAKLIQLREKDAPPVEFYMAAIEAIAIAREHGARIIINDRVDIALAANADGVHLGQDDLPPKEARKILGENAIIGFSTHSLEQALAACSLPINYIAIGPIFTTTSKDKTGEAVGLETLQEVRHAVGDFPLVGIGGIDRANLQSVIAAGADSAALISDLVSANDLIEARTREAINMANSV